MRLFGLTITREKSLASVDQRGGWWPIVRESYAGAWQENVEVKLDSVLSHSAVFRCVSLIASDVAKMRIRLVQVDDDGIWSETTSPSYSPILRKPNRFQNRIQFFTNWMESKLTRGNTYVLKERDNRGVVIRLYVLDPARVKPLVADDGSVYYELRQDTLSGLTESAVVVPAKEIIHDRWNTLFHPLVGLSPIFANGLAATQGQAIQNMSAGFFQNGAQPGGVLTAPGAIADETAARLKAHWDANYTGKNRGKVAVLGDGLKYEPMTAKMVDSQLVEQLKWSAETVCSVFGVPAYKAGVGPAPAYNNVEALNQQYYSDCLQIHIESVELCLDEGLEMKPPYGTEFDIDDLLRMDTATQIEALTKATTGGLMKPDEGRKKLGLKPVEGGDAVYLQQQNYSLAALARRDAQVDPFNPAPAETPTVTPDPANDDEAQARAAIALLEKDFREALNA
ncbi:phage portal protein [Brevundimonas aurantiaca]|uniref:phage portal protein n=1 Tax=Brevundimonas aurantiaca TaxID=74316 RepID=UPI001D19280F|nr:phage portal protein [Brevundimonas aurantiaca]MCC4295847.1 phage portal protein [Brevundimonas aurantiaca]